MYRIKSKLLSAFLFQLKSFLLIKSSLIWADSADSLDSTIHSYRPSLLSRLDGLIKLKKNNNNRLSGLILFLTSYNSELWYFLLVSIDTWF